MMTKFSGLNPNGPYLSLEKIKRHEFRKFHFAVRLFAVLYFSVRSSRSRALRYGLPILHECQNYLGDGGGGGDGDGDGGGGGGGGGKIEEP